MNTTLLGHKSSMLGRIPLPLLCLLALTLSLAPASLSAQKSKGDKAALWTDKSTGVQLRLALLPGMQGGDDKDGDTRGWWYGDHDGQEWTLMFTPYPNKEYGLTEPSAAMAFIDDYYAKQAKSPAEKRTLVGRQVLRHKSGYAPYAIVGSALLDQGKSRVWVFAGVTPKHAYSIEITVEGKDAAKAAGLIDKFFREGVSYTGKQWNPLWSEQDLIGRWRQDAPESLQVAKKKGRKPFKIMRTTHYVIMTNSSGGKLFGKKMEECYKKIRKAFPFEEIEGNRLMPVFLFRSEKEYQDFYMKIAKISREEAGQSKGHAWHDYYATWYEAPKDPVHIHEATHQIFMNRLFLHGGGSWLQEGVAEYMCEGKNALKSTARRAIHSKRHPSFREFMKLRSLIAAGSNAREGDLADKYYLLAGSIIACVKTSKWGKDKFMDFIQAIGSCPRNDTKAIEAALQRSLGIGIDEFEARWKKFYN